MRSLSVNGRTHGGIMQLPRQHLRPVSPSSGVSRNFQLMPGFVDNHELIKCRLVGIFILATLFHDEHTEVVAAPFDTVAAFIRLLAEIKLVADGADTFVRPRFQCFAVDAIPRVHPFRAEPGKVRIAVGGAQFYPPVVDHLGRAVELHPVQRVVPNPRLPLLSALESRAAQHGEMRLHTLVRNYRVNKQVVVFSL